jgi:hypothetical protein
MIHRVAWRCRARFVLSAGALLGCSVYQSELLTNPAASGGAGGNLASGGSGELQATTNDSCTEGSSGAGQGNAICVTSG